MRKYIFVSVLSVVSIIVLAILYLNVYGIKTNKFNNLINEKVKEFNPKLSIDIKDVFFKINLNKKIIKINTKNTKINLEKENIGISNFEINLGLFEFLKNENSIKDIEVISKENSIKSVTNFLNSYKFDLPRYVIFNQIKNGVIKIKANISFDKKKQKDFTYKIEGQVKKANLNIFNNYNIDDINFNFNIKDKTFYFDNIKLKYDNLDFKSKKILVEKIKDNLLIKGDIKSEKGLAKPNSISRLFNLNLDIMDNREILLETKNNFSFKIDSERSIKDLNYQTDIVFDKIFLKKEYQDLVFFKNGKINTKYSNKNLSIKIDSGYEFLNDKYNNPEDKNNIVINIQKNNKKDMEVQSFFKNKKNKINTIEFTKYFQIEEKFIKNQEINVGSINEVNFNINEKNEVVNLKIKSILNFDKINIDYTSKEIKKIFPQYNNLIILNGDQLEFNYSKNKTQVKANGKYSFKDKFDNFQINIINKNNKFDFETELELNKNLIKIRKIKYIKEKDLPAKILVKGIYKKDNEFNFKNLNYSDEKNKIIIKNLNLSKNYKVKDVANMELSFLNKNKKKNFIKLNKKENYYELKGDHFDVKPLVDNLLDGNSDNNLFKIFKNLNSEIILSFNKFSIDRLSSLNKIKGKFVIKNNKIYGAKIEALLNKKNKFSLNIKTNSNNEKITNLFIERPSPFINNYKFIKGFEEGQLSYDSIEKNGISKSNLRIYDFKVKKVPLLAKLLTLASLQGIADLLTGEGIRFDQFEMNYETENKLTKINEMYSIGPAISIMMEGYIEKDKLVSLRGTLVPATTINNTISKIPLLGNILVGKKVGEGVFGVSFKIKGPPKKLKTTVNPIKTLTPRFITRTLEKLKRN
mgnify:CR=1 FL=1